MLAFAAKAADRSLAEPPGRPVPDMSLAIAGGTAA